MSNIASGGSSEYTLNQEPRPGDAVANDSARSEILGFSINDTDREPVMEDNTVLEYKTQPTELVRELYTAMIDISEMRDQPGTRDFRILTEKKRNKSGREVTHYETKTMVAFCWRIALFMLDGAEKGFVRGDKEGLQLTEPQLTEPQWRSFHPFKLRLLNVTNALRREKSVLGALLHDGVGTIFDFIYAPRQFERSKIDSRHQWRTQCKKSDVDVPGPKPARKASSNNATITAYTIATAATSATAIIFTR
ncbi:hypothetical protein DBV05_g6705 [Lasiodiplodia theobromae]|uniref:Uncharacterized protein n=1 Tax=Lasiodiplodia theobromae TaxID=45133 RepID=A0A5N5DA39_9PEZI|nr:hypothetical protein DBV05_g6705 [Lasiodiplodia theobromae]